ncbi:hypothetical protein [Acetobacter persici]|nr:hypothetical protein [Acetobacter persici]
MEVKTDKTGRLPKKSAWALTPQDADHDACLFTILDTALPRIPSDQDSSLHRYAHSFSRVVDVPYTRGLPIQKSLSLWFDHLSKMRFIRKYDVSEWRKNSDLNEAAQLLKEAEIDALRFTVSGARQPCLVVINESKVSKVSHFRYHRDNAAPPSIRWLDKTPEIQSLNPDGSLLNLSSGGAAIQAACSKLDEDLVSSSHVVALALAEFLGGEKAGAGIGGIFDTQTERPVWIAATLKVGEDIIFLDRMGARKRGDIATQLAAGAFGNPDSLIARQGISLDSHVHEPLKGEAQNLAKELGGVLPPSEAFASLLTISSPSTTAHPVRKKYAWNFLPDGAKTAVSEFSILDAEMPAEGRDNTILVKYCHNFRKIAEVPDNDFMSIKDSLLFWLQHLASEKLIPPHKFLDWEVAGRSPKGAKRLLDEAGIDALKFEREDTGTIHLVALNLSQIEPVRTFDYQAQTKLSAPLENVADFPSALKLTGNPEAPFLNLTAGGMALRNACEKIKSPFMDDPHATAIALANYLGGEKKGAGMAAIVDTRTGRPVWVGATLDGLFLDRNGARKKRDLVEQMQSGVFGPPEHLSARVGISLNSKIHRPAAMKAQALLRELHTHMPPADAMTLLLELSAPVLLDDRIWEPVMEGPENNPEKTYAPEP